MRIERLGRSRWLAWDCRMRCAICAGLSVPISSARMQLQRGAARRGEDTVTSVLQEFQDSPSEGRFCKCSPGPHTPGVVVTRRPHEAISVLEMPSHKIQAQIP